MNKQEAHTLLEAMATEITRKLVSSGHNVTEQTKLLRKQLKAIDMAIEALSAPQTDLISRADAVMRDATAEERASVQRYIDSISAEAVQGEWIDTSEGTFCSECVFKTNEYYNYCPNCGADCRGNDYQRHIEDLEHCMRYEPTYNSEDGSM